IDEPASRADIVLWPESAMPFALLEEPVALNIIGEKLVDRVLVTGVTRTIKRGKTERYYNSAGVLDGVAGRLRLGHIYAKSQLRALGEFIPLWSVIGPAATALKLGALQQIGDGFTPGEPPTRIVIPGASDAAVLICYEAIFPGFTPRGAG